LFRKDETSPPLITITNIIVTILSLYMVSIITIITTTPTIIMVIPTSGTASPTI
jgi:hypothetical protein